MAINSYSAGQNVELRAEIRDPATRTLIDPPSVTCVVKPPTGANQTLTTTKESLGVYTANVTPNVEGVWTYKFTGTGVNPATDEKKFYCRASEVS